jgi:hypothetical protein
MLLPDLASAIREAHEAVCVGSVCATQDYRSWWIEIKDEGGAIVFSYPFVMGASGVEKEAPRKATQQGFGEWVRAFLGAVGRITGKGGSGPGSHYSEQPSKAINPTGSRNLFMSGRPWRASLKRPL